MDVISGGASISNTDTSNASGSVDKTNEKNSDWNHPQIYSPSFTFGMQSGSHGYQHSSSSSASGSSFKNFSSRQNDWAMHASSVYSSMASGFPPVMQTIHPETAAAIQSSFDPGVLGLVACRKGEGHQDESTPKSQSASMATASTNANTWHLPASDDRSTSGHSLDEQDVAVSASAKLSGKGGPYRCKTCGEEFAKRDGLRTHRRMEHSVGHHKCTECGKLFSHRSHLQQHVRIHTGEKLYKCQICHKDFIHSGSLSNHMKSHNAEGAGAGTASSTSPPASGAMTLKMRSSAAVTPTNAESDTSEMASNDGSKNSEYRRMPFVCRCGKKFACFAKLQLHERTHTGERPYKCNFCERAFAEKGNLEKHKRTHTRETPYLCRECGETFCHSYQLKRHKLKHTGDMKPFVCRQCGRGFLQEAKLQLHMRIHTGEKPYVCCICDKSFSEKGNLRQHERTHSADKPYHCQHCDKTFAHATGLRTHRKRHSLPHMASKRLSGSTTVGANGKTYVDTAVQTYTVVGPSIETYGPCGEPHIDRPPTFPYDRPHVLQRQDPSSIDPRYSLVHHEAMTSVGFDSRPSSAQGDSRNTGSLDNLPAKATHMRNTSSSNDPSISSKMSSGSAGIDSRPVDMHAIDSRMNMRAMDMRALDVRSTSALMHTAVTAGRDVISRSGYLSDMVPNSGVELRNVLAAAQETMSGRGTGGLRLPANLMPDMMSVGAMDARMSQGGVPVSGVELRCALGQDLSSPGVDSVSFSP